MFKSLSFLSLFLFLCSINISFASSLQQQNVSNIHNIMAEFSTSIINKDVDKFMALFVEQEVSWVGVISEETHKLLTSKNSAFSAQSRAKFESPSKFITDIAASPHNMREAFSNVVIKNDNNVATVTFDYEMYQNEFKKNWGQESWLLLKIDGQWKIHAVNFSLTLNADIFKQ